MVHFITYEFVGPKKPTNEAARIGRAIRELGACYAFHASAWILESELSNEEICQRLKPLLRSRDRLVSTRIHRDWVSANIAPIEADWLGSRNFTSVDDDYGLVRPMHAVR